ncbi:MAG TPA: LamG domain-containing protein [Verrucomicrobiae bacterium]|nr:LamG domain-containing protein [Verrucomicrobiae bacterium]
MKRLVLLVVVLALANMQTFASLSDGLVAFWSFDGTNAVDNSGNGHTGIAFGSPTRTPGIFGDAFGLHDGKSSIWIPPSNAFALTNNLTVGAWINYNSVTSSTFGSQILWFGDPAPAHDPWEIHLLHDGTAQFRVDCGTGNQTVVVNSSGPLAPHRWYLVAATESTTGNLKTLRLYINGSLNASLETNVFVHYDFGNMSAEIGAVDHGTWQILDGDIDLPFVYNRALTAGEIAEISSSGTSAINPTRHPIP